MLSRNQQKKFLRKNRTRIIFHLEAFCENRDSVDLHKMRLAIKKLKAFIYFLSKTTKLKNFTNLLSTLKPIFKHAGNIRNAQVTMELAKNFNLKNKRFCEEQEKIIESESVQFCRKALVSIDTIERTLLSIFPYLKDRKTKRIVEFFRNEIQKSGARLHTNMNTEEWHTLRKKIKNILYVYKMTGQSVIQKIPLNIRYLEDLQESIGKWHDIIMASDLIYQQTRSSKILSEKLHRQSIAQNEQLMNSVKEFLKKTNL